MDQSVKITAGPRGGKCDDGVEVLDKDAVWHRFCSTYTATTVEGSPCRLSFFFIMARQPAEGQGPLVLIEALLLHSDTPPSIRRLWTSDQPDAETCT